MTELTPEELLKLHPWLSDDEHGNTCLACMARTCKAQIAKQDTEVCPTCHRTGIDVSRYVSPLIMPEENDYTCLKCHGSGRVPKKPDREDIARSIESFIIINRFDLRCPEKTYNNQSWFISKDFAEPLAGQIKALFPDAEEIRKAERGKIAEKIEADMPSITRYGALEYIRILGRVLKEGKR